MTTNHRKICCTLVVCGAALVPAAATQARPAGAVGVSALRSTSRLPAGTALLARPSPPAVARVTVGANPATFDDATGDSGTAPDITSVVVSNDATNQITFRINVVKLAVPSSGYVVIAIDSDRNVSTGDQGTDYMFLGDLSTNSFVLARWSGSDFVPTPDSTASAGTNSTSVMFSINSSELGNTTGFSFWTRTVQGTDVTAGNHDDAPDTDAWDYQLGPTAPLKLTVALSKASTPRAGRRFLFAVGIVRSDEATATLSSGNVTCTARAGSAVLKPRSVVALGPAASCAWLLPKKSRGKMLHASVKVALDGATVTKTYAARIK